MIRPKLIASVLLAGLLVLALRPTAPAALAEPIPALRAVPAGLPEKVQKELTTEHAALDQDLKSFLDDADVFNHKSAEEQSDAEFAALQSRRTQYVTKAEAFNRKVDREEAKAKLAALDAQIPKTHDELVQFTAELKGYQAALDEWSTFGDADRKKAQEEIKYVLLTALLGKMSDATQTEVALSEDNVKIIRAHFGQAYMNQYLKDLTAQVKSLKTDGDVLHLLDVVKTGLSALPASDRLGQEETCTTALKVIELLNKDPKVALLIADGQIWEDTSYAWWAKVDARARVDQFLDLRDQQLKGIQSLSTLYKSEIDNRNKLRKTLAAMGD